MITLIITDCQNDFITGTMSVKGAKNSLEEIKKFIKNHKKEIEKILFPVVWHTYDHCTFKRNGGLNPVNCVQYTPGSCIEPKLLKYVQSMGIPYEVSERSHITEQEGAFDIIDFLQDELGGRYCFDSIVTAKADSDYVICGISGNLSVKATIQNMLDENIRPKVFMPGIVSTDGGKVFSEFVKENKLEKIV